MKVMTLCESQMEFESLLGPGDSKATSPGGAAGLTRMLGNAGVFRGSAESKYCEELLKDCAQFAKNPLTVEKLRKQRSWSEQSQAVLSELSKRKLGRNPGVQKMERAQRGLMLSMEMLEEMMARFLAESVRSSVSMWKRNLRNQNVVCLTRKKVGNT